MERLIGNKENPLSIVEGKEDLSLSYQNLSSKSESSKKYVYGK
jgi:hypothetical protein